ncbi:hypothetical protein FPV67DRAFT_1509713 [Lyophyllum atratum]|nr:hypothetical protein FPV67DRAFT_1509713 [Lyophyllum atratum]
MSTLAFNSLSRSSTLSPLFSAGVKSPQAGPQFRKRWLHKTLSRQAIMMPAMSPFMTAGTITRWKKKEGEAFVPGDVLLQILPDGTKDVPVEQIIALVINNDRELKNLSSGIPTPPPYNPIPSPISRSIASPVRAEAFNQPFFPPAHRSPTLVDMHAGHHHHRGIAMRHARGQKLTIVPPSPRMTLSLPINSVSSARAHMGTASTNQSQVPEKMVEVQDSPVTPVDGAAIRRMFLSSLSRAPSSASSSRLTLSTSNCDTQDYFDGVL